MHTYVCFFWYRKKYFCVGGNMYHCLPLYECFLSLKINVFDNSNNKYDIYIIYAYITKKCQKITVWRCLLYHLAHAKISKCLNGYVCVSSDTCPYIFLLVGIFFFILTLILHAWKCFCALVCLLVYECVCVCRNFSNYQFVNLYSKFSKYT